MNEENNHRTPDSAWFKARFDELGTSQRQFAARVGIDSSVMNRVVLGSIDPPTSRSAKIARLLGVSLEEIARRLGYEIPECEQVSVIGQVAPDGSVSPAGAGKYVTTCGDPEIISALVFASNSSLPGATAYLSRPIPAERCIGSLAFVEHGGARLRRIERGTNRVEGRYNLAAGLGSVAAYEENVSLKLVQRVVWMRL